MINKLKLVALLSLGIFVFGLGYKLGYSELKDYKELQNAEVQKQLVELGASKDATITLILQSMDATTFDYNAELNRLHNAVNSANARAKQATARALQESLARERELQLRGSELLTRLNKSFGSCARQIEYIRTYHGINSNNNKKE